MKRILAKYKYSAPAIAHTQLFINGGFVKSTGTKTINVLNPFNEKVLTQIPDASTQDVQNAIASARACFDSKAWKETPGAQRARWLNNLADLVEKNFDHLASLESLDVGKALFESRIFDIPTTISILRYYAGWADKLEGKSLNLGPSMFGYTRLEPVGVAGAITPWNFPLMLLTSKLAPAIAAGCTVVCKPAEDTSLTALYLASLLNQAGFPAGSVNIITGNGETSGRQLVESPFVDKISFTGSTAVGREIISKSAQPNIKRVTMELGGKSPNIILPDSDVDFAVGQSMMANYFNCGQCCLAGTRVFVHKRMYNEFVEKVAKAAKGIVLGDPLNEKTNQGPQISAQQQATVLGYIKRGSQEGAQIVTGGNRPAGSGYFVEPTVFAGVKDNMVIAREEIFGPVMSVLQYEDEEEVIRRANDTNYGLAAGIVTNKIDKALKLAERINAGHVYINSYAVYNPYTPFGGFKDSGIGREQGHEALHSYLETKAVLVGISK